MIDTDKKAIAGLIPDGVNRDGAFEGAAGDHGRSHDREVLMCGFNSRLDKLQAAYLDFQFKDYQRVIDRRRAVARLYHKCLGALSEVRLPPTPDGDPNHLDVFQNYEIEAERRDEFKLFLKEHGAATVIQWEGRPVHQFWKLGFTQNLPKTDRFFRRCLMFSMNMSLTDDNTH